MFDTYRDTRCALRKLGYFLNSTNEKKLKKLRNYY